MEFTQLSLAGGLYADGKSGGGDDGGETGLPMKRKWSTEAFPNTVDLQLKHPLPSDWEQCLDLQSGRMFYVNRKTSRKSWMRPEEQKLDLELNISTGHNIGQKENSSSSSSSSSSNMVALACSNCHLLVILCRSSPSCPNCKYVHSLASSSPKAKAPAPSSWGL
ncbi:protein CURLY FLAG LEAF 1-like [Salvia miltiorrhiza]|uniref:protein CURLY FLAG LEAF 1-like n=1 Tax=Salvia miltiorrhiza TaxID=226208 RepID=UPI0025ACD9C7|nr:protein CURLY FLAG LEAF 1-like [Salvia miltiorrhiza]